MIKFCSGVICLSTEGKCCPIMILRCMRRTAGHSDPALITNLTNEQMCLHRLPSLLVHQRRETNVYLMTNLVVREQTQYETALYLLLSSTHRRLQVAILLRLSLALANENCHSFSSCDILSVPNIRLLSMAHVGVSNLVIATQKVTERQARSLRSGSGGGGGSTICGKRLIS